MNRSALTPPPLWLRAAAAVTRKIPPVRGRGRIEKQLDRMLSRKGWSDQIAVQGAQMHLLLDDLQGRAIYIDGVIERPHLAAVRALVKPGSLVFDVGANMGYYSLLFAALVGEAGQVEAFEPVPEIAFRLRHNLALNQDLGRRVRVREHALSETDGQIFMNVATVVNSGASHVATPEPANDRYRKEAGITRSFFAPCRRGDSVWEDLGRPRVDVVKIDIEGHEPFAFRGMSELLSQPDAPVVLCEVRKCYLEAVGESRRSLFQLMASFGYAAFDYDETTMRFIDNDTPRDSELIIFMKGI